MVFTVCPLHLICFCTAGLVKHLHEHSDEGFLGFWSRRSQCDVLHDNRLLVCVNHMLRRPLKPVMSKFFHVRNGFVQLAGRNEVNKSILDVVEVQTWKLNRHLECSGKGIAWP